MFLPKGSLGDGVGSLLGIPCFLWGPLPGRLLASRRAHPSGRVGSRGAKANQTSGMQLSQAATAPTPLAGPRLSKISYPP